MAGRTPVPEKESIESFAAHQATMVVFLSTGLLEELSKRLIEGGYSKDTPAAIVYKATWEDEIFCLYGWYIGTDCKRKSDYQNGSDDYRRGSCTFKL